MFHANSQYYMYIFLKKVKENKDSIFNSDSYDGYFNLHKNSSTFSLLKPQSHSDAVVTFLSYQLKKKAGYFVLTATAAKSLRDSNKDSKNSIEIVDSM